MGRVKCVFCTATQKRAKEHVWPRWLQEFLGESDVERTETHVTTSGQVVSQRRHAARALVAGGICESCNNGWMNDLELRAAKILKPLLAGRTVSGRVLPQQDARTLALWTFKTAIVRNLATNYRQLVPRWHYQHLHAAQSIPDCVYIDIAVAPAHRGLTSLQSQTVLGIARTNDVPLIQDLLPTTYNLIAAIGPLLLRVIHFPLPGYWVFPEDTSRRLWPVTHGDVVLDMSTFTREIYEFESEASFRHVGAGAA
jgi:hypothetical protein